VIQAAFKPTTGSFGQQNAALTVSGTTGESATAQLSGTAVLPTPALLGITGPTNSFGTVIDGQTNTIVLTVTNNGQLSSGAIAVSGFSGPFPQAADTCSGNSLSGGASCTIPVTFAPTSGMSGVFTVSVAVTATPGGNTSATLTGTAILPARLGVSGMFDFGTVPDSRSLTNTFTVQNSGQSPSGALSNTFVMTPQFSADTIGCDGVVLSPGATCPIKVTYHPACCVTENDSTTLTVSGSPGGTVIVTVTGDSHPL
jgi:hypothetical protein